MGLSVENHSKFVMPTAPPTPSVIRPETGMTVFSMADTRNMTRLNTAFTELGVDEYLINECKKNNEYLQYASSHNSRAHTPNIYRIDSLERDFIAQKYNEVNDNVNEQSLGGSSKRNRQQNIMEKSIRSKSDFLYNVMASKQEDDMQREAMVEKKRKRNMQRTMSERKRSKNEDVVSNLLTKNQDRLKYFRQSTPLDATRSMKIGLQKLEDLLDQTERLNVPKSQRKQKRNKQQNIDLNDSLYELM